MKSLVLVLVFLAWFAAPTNADFVAGMAAYKSGDYATAFRELKPLAEQGNAEAQRHLGHLYLKGLGVPQDYKEAIRWYSRAAEQGRKVGPPNRKSLPPGWVLVAGEWKQKR